MLKTVCSHNCASCFAVPVCAVGAMAEETDLVSVDTEKCISCGACRTACLSFSADQGLAKQSQVRRKLYALPEIGLAATAIAD